MTEMNEPNFPSESQLDSLIERTLSRDAEAARARFATVPNAQLTVKLALKTASRSLLQSLGGKLAIYATGAAVAGAAIYFIPSFGRQPTPAPAASPATSIGQPAGQPPAVTEKTEMTQSSSKNKLSPIKADSQTSHRIATSPKPAPELDEGDDKNIPTITDKHYQPPLK